MGAEPGNQELDIQIEARLPEVTDTLRANGIPIEKWGQGKAKTVRNLTTELVEGETELVKTEDGELVRKVGVISMDVFHRGLDGKVYKLKETKQVFKEAGIELPERTKVRDHLENSLAEKVKPGENLDEAALRALQEELGVEIDVPVEQGDTTVTERVSDSYPGLKGRYEAYKYTAWLPTEAFRPDGYIEHQKEKNVYFGWTEIPDPTPPQTD